MARAPALRDFMLDGRGAAAENRPDFRGAFELAGHHGPLRPSVQVGQPWTRHGCDSREISSDDQNQTARIDTTAQNLLSKAPLRPSLNVRYIPSSSHKLQISL